MHFVYIYYTHLNYRIDSEMFSKYLERLPQEMVIKNKKLLHFNDKCAHLFGKLLLAKAFSDWGISPEALNELEYDKNNRPFLNQDIDFNISHSGEYVLCIIGRGLRVGIDIEDIKKTDLDNLHSTMSDAQWYSIKNSSNVYKTFLNYWAIKECVLKADGEGIKAKLDEMHVDKDVVSLNGKIWYVKKLLLDDNYSSYFATDQESVTEKLIAVAF